MKKLIQKIIQSSELSVEEIFTRTGKIYSFLNPVSYLHVRQYQDKYGDVDGLFADGGLLVMFISFLYGKKIQRYSFDMTSLAKKFFEYACEYRKTVYFIGAEKEYIGIANDIIKKNYPDLNVVEFRDGYFDSVEERSQSIQRIMDLQPDFVVVGMGSVVQDFYLMDLKKAGFKGIGFSCGGFFHQIAQNGSPEFYPYLINTLGIRYIYRMYKEPHTRKRYLKAAVLFPIEFFCDRFKND